jgi:hypothetical protein
MGSIKRVEVIPDGVIVVSEHWALRAVVEGHARMLHRLRMPNENAGVRAVPFLRVIAHLSTASATSAPAKEWRPHDRSEALDDPIATAPRPVGRLPQGTFSSLFGLALVHGLEIGLMHLMGAPLSPFSMLYSVLIAVWMVVGLQAYLRLVRRVPEVRAAYRRNTAGLRAVASDDLGESLSLAGLAVDRRLPESAVVALELRCLLAPFVFFLAGLPLRDELAASSPLTQHLAVLGVHWLAMLPLSALAYEVRGGWTWLWRRGVGRRLVGRVGFLQPLVLLEPTEEDIALVHAAVTEALWLERSV